MQYKGLILTLALSPGWCAVGTAHADFLSNPDWALCGEPHTPAPAVAETVSALPADEATYLRADRAEVTNNEIFDFKGDVFIRQLGQELEADSAIYTKSRETVEAEGNIRYREDGFSVQGDSAFVELETDEGRIKNSRYQIRERHARGSASTTFLEGPDNARLEDAQYTTCNPGDDIWYLNSTDVQLDQVAGVGTARNVWIEFKGVPILYSPYLTFPLNDERKSGFLTPSFGSSSEVGTELLTPYYWNIAPNMDATLTPRFTSDRGTQMLGEFRYLTSRNSGEVYLEYLPDDDLFGEDREGLFYQHRGSFAPRWSTSINYNYVSDEDYFEDLGTNLNVSTITQIERRADITYTGDLWKATGRLQGFQTVNDSIPDIVRPYRRFPQFLLSANLPQMQYGLNYLFDSEFVAFDHPGERVTGRRIAIAPAISYRLDTRASFVQPTLSLRHTAYVLDDLDVLPITSPIMERNPSRTLPVFSLDSGLFFERGLTWRSRDFLQTLEPRLFYLYVPFRDQSEIPLFDTSLPIFTSARLFQTNRFSGGDLVGDANQATLAVTSRLLDSDTGAQLLNFNLGQIYYFQDREVTLNPLMSGATPDPSNTERSSNIIAEARTSQPITGWTARATVQWDPHEDMLDQAVLGFRYQPSLDRFINLEYRLLRDERFEEEALLIQRPAGFELGLEQTDVSVLWPLYGDASKRWNAVARWNYSLEEGRTLDALVGVEYDTCCWAVRVAARRYANDIDLLGFNTMDNFDDETNDSIFVQLELKGLSSLGNTDAEGLRGILQDTISDSRGYRGNRTLQ